MTHEIEIYGRLITPRDWHDILDYPALLEIAHQTGYRGWDKFYPEHLQAFEDACTAERIAILEQAACQPDPLGENKVKDISLTASHPRVS